MTSNGLISNIYKQLIQLNIKKPNNPLKMGRRPEQTFFQKRHIDGQQAYEKMLNIVNHQRNANQNHIEILFHTHQNGSQITNVVEVMGKREPSSTVGGNVNFAATIENNMEVPQKTKHRTMI